jgi:hypothetical protein
MTQKLQDPMNELLAIKVHQWLADWDQVDFNPNQHRRKPEPHFYLFTMSALELKSLSGIYRRPTSDGYSRESNENIQRRHNKARSLEIRRFVEVGYPLSEEKNGGQLSQDLVSLQKPGWLPTSIVVNILTSNDVRSGQSVSNDDLIFVNNLDQRNAKIILPKSYKSRNWKPTSIHPIEVIDGQHRLWAFDDGILQGDFELPVVAFYGLDISWQAYLFWVINIKPKKINTSLAFDLYPLLRTEDWLEKFEGPKIYRQTRAQELTEALWSYPKSSWHQRIDMLGEHRQTMVSQAAWINSLLNTYIRYWEGKGIRIGGLYGAPVGKNDMVLGWSRTQQAAFLIFLWNALHDAVKQCKHPWAEAIRKNNQKSIFGGDPAFVGNSSLLNTDQGVRGVMYVTNDLCYLDASKETLPLHDWRFDEYDDADPETNAISPKILEKALKSLAQEEKITKFVLDLVKRLAEFDWRSAADESLKTDEEKMAKLVFRGSGGYRELRRQLLKHLMGKGDNISNGAEEAYKLAGFEL